MQSRFELDGEIIAYGKTLEEMMKVDPANIEKYMSDFVDMQLTIQEKKAPMLNDLKEKLARQINSPVTVHYLEDKEAPHITMNDGGVHNKDFQIPAFVRDNRPEITVKCESSADGGATWQAVGYEKTIHKAYDTVSWTVPVEGLTDGVLAVRVTATDFAGNQSTYTVEHILDFTPPAPPTGLAVEVKSSTEVSLTWDMPAAEENIRSFWLYYSTDGTTFTRKGGPSSNGMTVSNLEPGQTYYFYVTAVDTAGNEVMQILLCLMNMKSQIFRKLQIRKESFEVKESNGYMKNTLRNVTSEW